MTPVRLEPVAPRSGVKHSTTEPLRSRIRWVNSLPKTPNSYRHMKRTPTLKAELTEKRNDTYGIILQMLNIIY